MTVDDRHLVAELALEYAARGWHVLALEPRSKLPAQLGPGGRRLAYNEATVDRELVVSWWRRLPEANVGIRCDASGILVLDVDPRHGGDDQLHDLQAELGALPDTVEGLTGGGGQHLVFAAIDGKPVGRLAPGVDVKYRGYIVAPPSLHPSGRPYTWSVDGDPTEIRPAALPAAWVERLASTPTREPPTTGDVGGESNPDDFLRRRPPAEYVKLIAGVDVGRDGKICCPFHDDATPSLHVYETPERGWFCFGCERGGSIFEFAALRAGYSLPLRGAEFLRIEQALLRLYGRYLGVPEAV